MDGVVYLLFIIVVVEYIGYWCDIQLFDIFVGVQVVFYVYDNLGILVVDGEFVGVSDVWVVQQCVNGKYCGVFFDCFELE